MIVFLESKQTKINWKKRPETIKKKILKLTNENTYIKLNYVSKEQL